jgi:RNA polymerase sigma factor (sigma-70 family)
MSDAPDPRSPETRRPVQRGLPASLRNFESTEQAAYLSRLAADEDLVLRLQLSGFDPMSEDWQTVARALFGYGYDVFRSWIGTGRIHLELKAKGVSGRNMLAGYLLQPGDEHELAAELMLVAVESYRRTLAAGRWRRDGGASLKSFFVGHCLFKLPDVFKAWTRWERRNEPRPLQRLPLGSSTEMAHRAEMRVLAEQELGSMPDRTRRMFELQQHEGLGLREIAETMDLTEGQVRTTMSRARRRLPDGEEFPWVN